MLKKRQRQTETEGQTERHTDRETEQSRQAGRQTDRQRGDRSEQIDSSPSPSTKELLVWLSSKYRDGRKGIAKLLETIKALYIN